MKKVNIKSIKDKQVNGIFTWQNAYGVWLDWGVNVSFSNKKTAYRFIAYVNEQMTAYSFELSDICAALFTEYRRLYFSLAGGVMEKRALFKYFRDAEHYFERLTEFSEKHGYALSTVRDLNKCCECLADLCLWLRDHYKSKNKYTDARIVAGLLDRIWIIQEKIKELPASFYNTSKKL